MAHSGETPGIPERPLKRVRVRCEKGRNIGPFVALASWRFKVFLGSGLINAGLPYLKLANNTEPFEAGVTWRACQQIGRAGQSSCGPQGSTAASISKGNRVGSWDTASLLTRFSHSVDAAKQTGCHATAPLARRLGNVSRCWAQDVSRRTGSRQSDALIDFPVFAHYSIFLTNPR